MQIQRRLCAILLTSTNQLVIQAQQHYWTAIATEVIIHNSMETALTEALLQEYGWQVRVIEQAFLLEHALTDDLFLRQWYYVCRLIEPRGSLAEPFHTYPLDQAVELDVRPIRFKTYLTEHLEGLQKL